MAARRSKLELVFDILSSIQNKGGQIKPTHLMYKSNLSHKLLNQYLEGLMGKGMVAIVDGVDPRQGRKKPSPNIGKMVVITEKGLDFLSEFRKMREFTDTFGL